MDVADEGIARPLLLKGIFEPEETALWRELLRPGMVVVDVGANIGYYATLASRLVGPTGRVFAFEPEPKNYELLLKNLAENGCANVEASSVALSDRRGSATLFRDAHNLGNPSFFEANVPQEGRIAGIKVSTTSLDEALPPDARVDVIKVDVQGAEGLVFAGARRVLGAAGKRHILFELWPDGLDRAGIDAVRLLEELQEMGYRFRRVGRDRRPVEPQEAVSACRAEPDGFVNLLASRA